MSTTSWLKSFRLVPDRADQHPGSPKPANHYYSKYNRNPFQRSLPFANDQLSIGHDMLATKPSGPLRAMRRSPLVTLLVLILVIQSYYLFKYNSQAAELYQDDAQETQNLVLEPIDGHPNSLLETSTIIITKTALVGPSGATQAVLPQKTTTPTRAVPVHDVVLAIKTGSTVIHARVPIQLLSIVPNFPNTMVFSDIKMKLGDWEVADALRLVSSDVAGSALSFWKDIQKLHAENVGLLDADGKLADLKDGWHLDKFKNIPILIESYQKFPHASYYLYIDGDTSLISSNWFPYLLEITQKNDPLKDPVYWGSLALINDLPFAHGGSGYLINQAAMRGLFPGGKYIDESYLRDFERNYTKFALSSCCGDFVLGQAMTDRARVELQHKWPYFQGETWWSIPYHDSNFCHRMGTLHHVTPEDMQQIYDFEQAMLKKTGMHKWRPDGWTEAHELGQVEWDFSDMPAEAKKTDTNKYKYILFRDLFDWFISTRIPDKPDRDVDGQQTKSTIRVGWDNLSWKQSELNGQSVQKEGIKQWQKDAITTERNCRLACEKYSETCVQWYFRDGICGLSEKIVYGRRLPHRGTDSQWRSLGVSGWIPDRVQKSIARWRQGCPGQI